MTKNFKNNTLTDSLLSGAAAIALIAGVGIAAAPAQAQMVGALEWDDGTSNFFDDVNPVVGDIFSVDFVSPLFTSDVTTVSGASGLFSDFGPFPDTVDLIPDAPTGNFSYSSDQTGLGAGFFRYQLDDPLVFNFDPNSDDSAEASVTFGAGSTFVGEFDTNPAGVTEGVEFELDVASNATQVTVGGEVYSFTGGSDGDNFITGDAFVFGDIPETTIGGTYGGEVSVQGVTTTPEPTTILSLLAVGGLGLGLKRKKQSKQLSA